MTALRRRDAALAASAARSGADPGLHPGPHPGRVPATGGFALASGNRAGLAAASNPGDVDDSDGAEGGSGAEEGAGAAAPGVVSFVGAHELTTQRKRRRREPPPPEQPPAKRKAASKAQGASSELQGKFMSGLHGLVHCTPLTVCAGLAYHQIRCPCWACQSGRCICRGVWCDLLNQPYSSMAF